MIEQKVKKYFDEAKIPISEKQIRQFAHYYKLIVENNDDNDLTRIKGEDQFVIKHFIDSVYYTKFLSLPESIVDIGTGAGFPGIPLKIMNPEIHLILAEQRSRRVEFLKLAVKELKLTDVEFYAHKVTEKSFFNVRGVVTRALEDAPETLSRVEHFLPEGGAVIFLKGPDATGDIQSLSDSNRKNYTLELDKSYTLPGTDFSRRILLFRKGKDTFRKIYKIMKNEMDTPGIAITSEDNKTYKEIKRLAGGEGIKKLGSVAIAGKKIISDYLAKNNYTDLKLLLPDDYSETSKEFDLIISRFRTDGSLYILKKSLYNELDVSTGKTPILIAPLPELNDWDGHIDAGCTPVIPFQDPLNVGSAVRSAAGFGITKIILASDAANPFHPKSVRASSGAVFEMEFSRGPALSEIFSIAEKSGIEILALDKNGRDISEVKFPPKFILIPGIEGPGLPDVYLDKSVSIPLSDKIESLNASVALSIFMYEWNRKK
ncbi:MAG TPA: 16S rRNA (guanine(527)-N(7))-methyltransferase RsmG [Spirochaetota bacterium]|nr:16S rRNA (guanine(527)-N(7))-methyltransferase RsmG [Spirochaetota bacterium]